MVNRILRCSLEPFARFARDERGAALFEYAIVALFFAVAMIATLTLVQNQTGTTLTDSGNTLTGLSNYP